jgi:type VI protein secretion system component VasK
MKTSHTEALRSFARDLQWLLALRLGVQLATVWFFVWGVVVLALRFFGTQNNFWLACGLFGISPLILISIFRARQRKPDFSKLRANYDRLNACGGVMMAEETADMGAWLELLPNEAGRMKIQWRCWRHCCDCLFPRCLS